jgi:hypothetical protein
VSITLVSVLPYGLTLDAILVVGITVLVTVTPLLPAPAQVCAAAGIASLALVAWFKRCRAAAPVGVFCVVSLGLALSGVHYSQLVLGVGLLMYAVVVRRVPWLQGVATWVRWGSFGPDVRVLTAASGLIAAVALSGWYLLLHPNIDDIVQTFVPDVPLGLLIAGGLVFSMVNAAVEEGAYRGVLLHGLDTTLGPGLAALALQAMAFGALHVQGFPRGSIGVGLASIYGLFMGVIRRRAGGMFAPWMAHVFTDIVIAGIVVTIGRPNIALHPTAAWILSGRG